VEFLPDGGHAGACESGETDAETTAAESHPGLSLHAKIGELTLENDS
jgi:hypothetical protein